MIMMMQWAGDKRLVYVCAPHHLVTRHACKDSHFEIAEALAACQGWVSISSCTCQVPEGLASNVKSGCWLSWQSNSRWRGSCERVIVAGAQDRDEMAERWQEFGLSLLSRPETQVTRLLFNGLPTTLKLQQCTVLSFSSVCFSK
jgi:hypothetical protein